MHGLKAADFYKTSEEKDNFNKKLEKGYKLLDLFVDYSAKLEKSNTFDTFFRELTEMDKKMFDLSAAIIEFMPEFTPSWNYRKKYIQKTNSNNRDELIDSLMNERLMTQKSLKKSPKSYSIWHHRLWTVTSLFNIKVENLLELLLEEHNLCFKLFKYDGRNFHCWNYFNFVRHYLKLLNNKSVDLESLSSDDIFNLINENFSNYSAWFQRSKLPYKDNSPKEDLELIKTALYTDPNDQTMWNYYNWLLFKRNTLPYYLCYQVYMEDERKFHLYFNTQVHLDKESSGFYNKDDEKVKGTWTSLDMKFGLSYVWSFEFDNSLGDVKGLTKFEVSFLSDNTYEEFYSHLFDNPNFFKNDQKMNCRNTNKGDGNNSNPNSKSNSFTSSTSNKNILKLVYYFNNKYELNLDNFKVYEMGENLEWAESNNFEKPKKLNNQYVCLGSKVTTKTLKEQLEVIDDIVSIDTESKYLLIAKLKIMETLGDDKGLENMYDKLVVLDPLRKQYYLDMMSNYKARLVLKDTSQLERTAKNLLKVNLSGLSLLRLEYNTLVPYFGIKQLDLSNNKLYDSTILSLGSFLLLLEELDLSGNNLKSLLKVFKSLVNLTRLKRLNLSGNPLEVVNNETKVDSRIEEIELTNTPLIKDTNNDYNTQSDSKNESSLFVPYRWKKVEEKESEKVRFYLCKSVN